MKYFLKGIIKIVIITILLPIILPLFAIDMIFWIGGADPFNTPITPIREKIGELMSW